MKIRNWSRFQHFKDRRPPWIKLHREILDQRDINLISDRSFRVLVGLWLLASEDEAMEGNLPPIPDIAFRLRLPEKDINKAFQELKGFVEQGDIKMISSRYQDDVPETETETETETEERGAPNGASRSPKKGTRLPDDWQLSEDGVIYAEQKGMSLDAVDHELEKFINYWRSAAGAKGVKLDWDATWRNWVLRVTESNGAWQR